MEELQLHLHGAHEADREKPAETFTAEGYDTFGNLVRLPRNQGKSQQKSLEIRKSGFTSEITICHQILFEIHVKS